jgi:hypothetical protein
MPQGKHSTYPYFWHKCSGATGNNNKQKGPRKLDDAKIWSFLGHLKEKKKKIGRGEVEIQGTWSLSLLSGESVHPNLLIQNQIKFHQLRVQCGKDGSQGRERTTINKLSTGQRPLFL